MTLHEQCTGDLGPYYLTSSHSINDGTYQTVMFDFIMKPNGTEISDLLAGFNKNDVIETLQELNDSHSISYSADFVKNKLILNDLKKRKARSYAITVSTFATVLVLVVIVIVLYICKKTVNCSKKNNPYLKTRKFERAKFDNQIVPIVGNETNTILNNSAISFPDIEDTETNN